MQDLPNPSPSNSLVTPLLTDLYQITMAYGYWKSNRHKTPAIFELFFRKNPFGGEYTIFCGLDEVLKHLAAFRFTACDIEYLRNTPQLCHCDDAFFDEYLAQLDCSEVKLYSMQHGRVAFPKVPLLTVVGPLGIGQLLETTLLTLVNYPSLVATNAARMVVAANEKNTYSLNIKKPKLAEFGLRRAQGPDGGFSASKYSAIGGFDGTSNVLAGKILNINLVGTHAHSFVQTYKSLSEVEDMSVSIQNSNGVIGKKVILLPLVQKYRNNMNWHITNDGELAAFISYACAFPNTFLCLIDTYDTLQSGIKNYILVCLALSDLGYIPKGVRLDSGDLSYISIACSELFHKMLAQYPDKSFFGQMDIVASNDINEEVLHSLNKEGHAITMYGIGTNLVTCQAQPALGGVYKLVEINGEPRIKLSQDAGKVLIPGQKHPYRLYGEHGYPLLDIMVQDSEEVPQVGQRLICRHPFIEKHRVAVVPSKVVPLHFLAYDGKVLAEGLSIDDTKQFTRSEMNLLRVDILRPLNPYKYKVSVSEKFYEFFHALWQKERPLMELR